MDKKKLDYFRKKLLTLRSEIMNRGMTPGASKLSITTDDMADESDHAAAVVQQNIALTVQERDRFLMLEIENALAKFEMGTYGMCEDTEEPIEEARLEAQPWTRYCIEAAEIREKKAKMYASNTGS